MVRERRPSPVVLVAGWQKTNRSGLRTRLPRPGVMQTLPPLSSERLWLVQAGRHQTSSSSIYRRLSVADRTIKLGKYEWVLGDQIGGGGFGQVFEAAAAEVEQSAVVKLVLKVPGAQRELLFVDIDEARNIIPVLDAGENASHYGLAMARAEKSLRQRLTKNGYLSEPDAVAVLRDIAVALEDLDGRLVHRDLKPENVLYLDGTWCVADFGISRYAEATTAADTRKYSMTPSYAAPEQWRAEHATGAADVYAFGVMAFELLTGRWPFRGPDFREQHYMELRRRLTGSASRWRHWSPSASTRTRGRGRPQPTSPTVWRRWLDRRYGRVSRGCSGLTTTSCFSSPSGSANARTPRAERSAVSA